MNIASIYKQFPTQKSCLEYLGKIRWQVKPICPYCGGSQFSSFKNEPRYHCNSCNTSFSVSVGTVFHRTHLDLQKWFLAVFLILNTRKNISVRQLSKDIKVNRNTAWSMTVRIRSAMLEYRKLFEKIIKMDDPAHTHHDERKRGDPHGVHYVGKRASLGINKCGTKQSRRLKGGVS